MRLADDDHLVDGRVRAQDVLHLNRVELETAPADDVLSPPRPGDVAVIGDGQQVPAAVEAVGRDGGGGELRLAVVAHEEVGPSHLVLAGLAGGDRLSGVDVDDPELEALEGHAVTVPADLAGIGGAADGVAGRLRAAIDAHDREAEAALSIDIELVGARARGDEAHRLQQLVDLGALVEEVEDVRAHGDEDRPAVAGDLLGDRTRLPARDRQDGGAIKQRHVDVEDRPARVAVGREGDLDVVLPVFGADPEHAAGVDQRIRAVDDALRHAGGTAGAEHQAGGARVERRRLHLGRAGAGGLEHGQVLEARTRRHLALHHERTPGEPAAEVRQRALPLRLAGEVSLEDQPAGVELVHQCGCTDRPEVGGSGNEGNAGDDRRQLEDDALPAAAEQRDKEVAGPDALLGEGAGEPASVAPQLGVGQLVVAGDGQPGGVPVHLLRHHIGEGAVLPVALAPVIVLHVAGQQGVRHRAHDALAATPPATLANHPTATPGIS